MDRSRQSLPLLFAGLLFLGTARAAGQEAPVLARVDEPGRLETLGLPVRAHLAGANGRPFALVLATRACLEASGVSYRVVGPDGDGRGFGLAAAHPGSRPAGEPRIVQLGPGGAPEPGAIPAIPLDRDLVLAPPAIAPVGQAARDEQVAEMVARVRADDLTGWESKLTGVTPLGAGALPVTLTTRNTRSGPQIDAATQFVRDEFASMGLSARFHDWTYAFTSNRNVVAELPGGSRASEIVLVTAHVDDMPAGGPAPGADDNASGVSGVLETARVLKDFRFDRTVRFVVLTGEEQGLYGSKSYAALVSAAPETVVAVLNLDMIGWDRVGGPVMNLHTRLPGDPGYPADLSIANLFGSVVSWYGLSGVLAPRVVSDGEPRSDHSPFWAAGIPGVLAIEDDLDDFDMAYHSPSDVASRLNVDYFANVVRATVGVAAHLAGPAPEAGATTLAVPVILSAPGAAGSYFTSELSVTNHGNRPGAVTYRYTASSGGGSGSFTESLGAGVQRIVPDAIEFLRSAGLPIAPGGSRLGTLLVTFEGLGSASDAGVVARTTTPIPGPAPGRGRAGLAYRGVPSWRLAGSSVVLAALRQDAADRSNVAVLNAGTAEGPVTLRVSFVEGRSGSALGAVDSTLEPGAFEQFRLLDIAPQAAGKGGWVAVERLSGRAGWYAYGVVNDQANSDGSLVAPVDPASGEADREVILPAVVEAGGYETEVTVTNASGSARDLLLTFSAQAVLTPTKSAAMKLHLEAREQRIIPRFVAALRDSGAPGFAGANPLPFVGPLAVSGLDGAAGGIVVTGRTLNAAPVELGVGGRFGVAYPGVRSWETSDGPVWLDGLQQDARSRTNVAVVNAGDPGGGDIEVRIELFDGATGAKAGEVVRTVPPRQFVQVDGILSLVPGAPAQGYARVTRLSGTGRFIAYAVVNDGASPGEGSGDGAYVASESGS